MHATRITVAEAAVTVISNSQAVTAWCARYVRPWWDATAIPAEQVCTGPVVIAETDPGKFAELAAAVRTAPHTSVEYARSPMLLARDGDNDVITGVVASEGLAYRSEPSSGRLTIYGCADEALATATARLAREAARGVLLRSGWTILHASAVAKDKRVILTLGDKGAGKTTTAVTLAARNGWALLANDRVFVRPDNRGGVWILPWPSAAALGLGLLNALGWYDVTRERLEGGEALHPTQIQRVTDAILSGVRTPLWDGKRELKAQIWPDQFPRWFSLNMSTGGQAAALLFPQITPSAEPALTDEPRALADADFMSGKTEDRYPDVFQLARVDGGGTAQAREAVTERLAGLPHHSVVLGHDIAANGEFLNKLVTGA